MTDTLDETLAKANEAARRARNLRVATDLMLVYMQDSGPRMRISMECALLAAEEEPAEAVNIILSLALGICGNSCNAMLGILNEWNPKLAKTFLQSLPSVIEALRNGVEHGGVLMMDGRGVVREDSDGMLEELASAMRERYGIRDGAKRQEEGKL